MEAERLKSAPEIILSQETYPVYRLQWVALKAYLESKYPSLPFTERVVSLNLKDPARDLVHVV